MPFFRGGQSRWQNHHGTINSVKIGREHLKLYRMGFYSQLTDASLTFSWSREKRTRVVVEIRWDSRLSSVYISTYVCIGVRCGGKRDLFDSIRMLSWHYICHHLVLYIVLRCRCKYSCIIHVVKRRHFLFVWLVAFVIKRFW